MAIYHKTPQDANRITPRPDEIPPIPAPKPDAVMNNRFANDKIQAMGSEWFQGEEMVAQRNAIKEMRSQPSNLPPTETQSTGDYGDPFMQPLNQNDPGFEHMRYYKSAKTDDERKFLIKHSETHGDEVINDGKISNKTQRVHDSLNNVAKSRVNKLLKDGLVKKNLKEEKKY